ncbi:MotE family protein [Acetonema longum]|uniref:Magnesium transporter MgtE intracellular domain-containing protein n=1 Tax=Acetonema longum DSM 6540 TaxID=1009370 RepID=F7NL46_9FIRM|nr:hypothetical protein [Acetonema longum]EGO63151.1 hypothetical protein ALO_14092 [Acetonema longum DSM 6540]
MADNTTKSADNTISPPETETKKSRIKQKIKAMFGRIAKLIRVFVFLILFVALLGVGFAAGIYFKFFNMNKLLALDSVQTVVQRLDLPSYPIIGKYFVPGAFADAEEEEATPAEEAHLPLSRSEQKQAGQSEPSQPAEPEETPQEKTVRLEAEKKRIAKLSRLCSEMKPDQAVPILNRIEDELVIAIFNKMEEDQVAKLLTRLDPMRAARLIEFMAKGKVETAPVKPDNPETNPAPGANSALGTGSD